MKKLMLLAIAGTMLAGFAMKCWGCKGTGWRGHLKCITCNGTGRL